jgi:predicted extracellular nuclease
MRASWRAFKRVGATTLALCAGLSPVPFSPLAQADSTAVVSIHDIQGRRHISPLNGQRVTDVRGIVTATRARGFYLQEPNPDGDPATSEGIFVFTDVPPLASVGDALLVSGLVQEYRPGGATSGNLTRTEITAASIVVVSHHNRLPAPVIIGRHGRTPPQGMIGPPGCGDVERPDCGFDPAHNALDFFESLESMRVRVEHAIVVGPTSLFGETVVIGDRGARAKQRTPRGGVHVSVSNFNPARIILDDKIVALSAPLNVGDTIAGVTGVLDYSFGNFKLEVTQLFTIASGGLQRMTTRSQDLDQLAIATFNVENLAPDSGQAKFNALAAQIVDNLAAPDIVALTEVQDNDGATNDGVVDASLTLNMLIEAVVAAGGPRYSFRQIDPQDGRDGGQPGSNIRVALLFNPVRVSFIDRPGGTATAGVAVVEAAGAPQLTGSPGRVDPSNVAFADSRKPLAGELLFHDHKLFVIANHFKSKRGDPPLFGQFQPPVPASESQRLLQARAVHDFVQRILEIDADANVVVLGDLNDFEFSPVLATLQAGVLTNLIGRMPAAQRYTYIFDGNSQALDHILVSPQLLPHSEVDIVHVNAEFADQASDHDPTVARLYLPRTLDHLPR